MVNLVASESYLTRKKTCLNPQYFKAGTSVTVKLKDDHKQSGDPADSDSEMNNNNGNSSKSALNVLGRFGQRNSSNRVNSQHSDMNSNDKTPANISRQLQFGGNSQGNQHQLSNISRVSSAQSSGRINTKVYVKPLLMIDNLKTNEKQQKIVSPLLFSS